ncbi:MAG TPA: hypothetical protein PKG50_03325 [Candidatus Bipolaricaulis anaerobius]|nr:hypothetical protein [Candidatus Bipolaricaulis anaerobius]HNS23480.1 hypothetical protein [Candidatus Bipolaricaulis anaerobius]
MAELVFACLAEDEPAGRRALLLARSLRAFGGRMAGSSVWVLAPREKPLPESVRDGLRAAGADLVPLATCCSGAEFPFGAKVLAAGVAETRAAATRSTWVMVCRYEDFCENPAWEDVIPVEEPLRGWLSRELPATFAG